MLLDLTEVLSQDGKILKKTVLLEMDAFQIRTGRFPLIRKSPLKLEIVNTGNRVLEIAGYVKLTAVIPCARCLSPVEQDFVLDIQRQVDMKLSAREREEILEESNFIEGNSLDPEILVCNELLVQWPIRVLCKEDCKGICSRCGRKGACSCDTAELDPRMAAIRDIFSKFKEV
mgnify:FL=1